MGEIKNTSNPSRPMFSSMFETPGRDFEMHFLLVEPHGMGFPLLVAFGPFYLPMTKNLRHEFLNLHASDVSSDASTGAVPKLPNRAISEQIVPPATTES